MARRRGVSRRLARKVAQAVAKAKAKGVTVSKGYMGTRVVSGKAARAGAAPAPKAKPTAPAVSKAAPTQPTAVELGRRYYKGELTPTEVGRITYQLPERATEVEVEEAVRREKERKREAPIKAPTIRRGKFERAEEWVAERTTKRLPPITPRAERAIETGVSVYRYFSPTAQQELVIPEEERIRRREFETGEVKGMYRGIREKPLKTAAMAGAFFLLPAAISGARYVGKAPTVARALKPVAPIGKKVWTAAKYGLPAFYAGAKGVEVYKAPTVKEKGAVIGEAVTTELAPMYIGAKAGAKYLGAPIERAIMIREIKEPLPPAERVKFEAALKVAKGLRGVEPKVKEVELREVEHLPKKAVPVVKKFLIEEKPKVVFGSVAQRTQVYKKLPKSHDIDVIVAESRTSAARLAGKLKAARVEGVKLIGGKVYIKGYGKAVEFHEPEMLTRTAVKPMGKAKTPSGIKVMKVGEQLGRKAIGGFIGRPKDIPHFEKIYHSVIKTAKIQAQKQLFFRKYKLEKIREIERAYQIYKTGKIPEVVKKLPAKGKAPEIVKARPTVRVTEVEARPTYEVRYPEVYTKYTTYPTAYYKPYVPYKVPYKTPYKPYKAPYKPPYAPPTKPYKAPYKPYKKPYVPPYKTPYKPYKAPYKPVYKPAYIPYPEKYKEPITERAYPYIERPTVKKKPKKPKPRYPITLKKAYTHTLWGLHIARVLPKIPRGEIYTGAEIRLPAYPAFPKTKVKKRKRRR